MEQLITPTLLAAAGIKVTDEQLVPLLEHANNELDERIGQEVTESLDDAQLETLVTLQEKATDEEVAIWLDKNVPELQQIIQDELDILIGEIAEDADKFTVAQVHDDVEESDEETN